MIRSNEYFGFTETEVKNILQDTGCTEHAELVKLWYVGYRFGAFDIYCPWDVLNDVNKVRTTHITEPENFWEHTSDNALSAVFSHVIEVRSKKKCGLKLPNAEVKEIFKNSIDQWFSAKSASCNYRKLWQSLWSADTEDLGRQLSDLLFDTISYHDYSESFYHAFLTGLFSGTEYVLESNYENGLGRSDLVIKDRTNRRAVVIEAKIAKAGEKLASVCEEALSQIEKRKYAQKIERAGYGNIVRLGMAFYHKSCLVKK